MIRSDLTKRATLEKLDAIEKAIELNFFDFKGCF